MNANLPLPLIVGIGYVSEKAYAIEERQRDYTFPAQGDKFKQGGGAGDFYVLSKLKLNRVLRKITTLILKSNISLGIPLGDCLVFTCCFISLIYSNITPWRVHHFGGETVRFCLKMNLGLHLILSIF